MLLPLYMSGMEITRLLKQWEAGDHFAEGRLFEILLPQLKQLAKRQLSTERRNHTLQPTELVQQLYLRLAKSSAPDWQDRHHFFAVAARIMSRYLIDYAKRRKMAVSPAPEDFPELQAADPRLLEQMVQIGELMERLLDEHPLWCKVVELKFFIGLTDEEAAEILSTPVRTVQRHWHYARRWLFERLAVSASA